MATSLSFGNEIILGHKFSILKSALHKYARRNEEEKGIQVLLTIDSIRDIENDIHHRYQKNAAKLRTNTANRLIVILGEEVNINLPGSNVYFLNIFFQHYKEWHKTRLEKTSMFHLTRMYQIIISSKKCRIMSDLKTVYNLPPYYVLSRQKMTEMHKILLYDFEFDEISDTIYSTSPYKRESSLREFKKCVYGRNMMCFAHLSRILQHEEYGEIILFNLIFKTLNRMTPALVFSKDMWDSLSILEIMTRKMTHKEKPILLYTLILFLIRRNDLVYDKANALEFMQDIEYNALILNKNIKMDDYVYGKATDFEGSSNEDTRYLNFQYRQMYIEFERRIFEVKNVK